MEYKILLIFIIVQIYQTKGKIPKCCSELKSFNSKFQCVPSKSSPNYLKTSLFKILNEDFEFSTSKNSNFNLQCKYEKSKKFKLTSQFLSVLTSGNSDVKFCVDMLSDEIHILTCPCQSGTCVHVCCQPGYMLNTDNGTYCVPATEEWLSWTIDDHTISPYYEFAITYDQKPKCKDGHYPLEETNVTVLTNGSLLYMEDKIYLETPNNYCIGVANNSNTIEVSALVCVPTEIIETEKRIKYENQNGFIYGTLFLIGAIFIFANFVIYAVLPELRRNIQGLSLMAHCGCMLIAYIGFIIIKACGRTLKPGSCHFIAYLVQYTFLAGFCWMNVICIDIAAKFRSLQSMVPRNLQELKKFKLFSIYAMGVPVIIFIITLSLNLSTNVSDFFNPGIGTRYCWFDSDSPSIVLYFYGPICLILLANTVLFIFTAVKIQSYTKDINRSIADKNGDKKRFFLFVKLFSLMGITWITEIISWKIGGVQWYWLLTDGINILRPVVIFIIFCCKTQVWELLKSKCSKIKGDFEQQYSLSTRSRGEQTSFSNQTGNTTSDQMQGSSDLDNEQSSFRDCPL